MNAFCFPIFLILTMAPPLVRPPLQLLAPHVRIWDSVSLNTVHVIGMGGFDRAVTCVSFSKSVSGV